MKIFKVEFKFTRFIEVQTYQDTLVLIDNISKQFPNDKVEFKSKDVTYEIENDPDHRYHKKY